MKIGSMNSFFFFFQAEDGIRDLIVTGVQTCALPIFDGLADQFLPGVFDPPAFSLRLSHKDVSLAVALGRELGVPMRMANLALEELTEAINRGWSERDSRVAMLLQEERAGVRIEVPVDQIREVLEKDGR